jgi:hypothetical protein
MSEPLPQDEMPEVDVPAAEERAEEPDDMVVIDDDWSED